MDGAEDSMDVTVEATRLIRLHRADGGHGDGLTGLAGLRALRVLFIFPEFNFPRVAVIFCCA